MINRRYVIEPGVIDLEATEVFDKQGNRIDNAYVDQAVADFHAATPHVGRPSLTSPGAHSPTVSFRIPEALRAEAQRRAAEDGVSLSRLAREALEAFLARAR